MYGDKYTRKFIITYVVLEDLCLINGGGGEGGVKEMDFNDLLFVRVSLDFVGVVS